MLDAETSPRRAELKADIRRLESPDREARKRSSTYRPGGKAQWLLQQLEFAPMSRADLMFEADLAQVRKASYVVAALITDGMIRHTCNQDELTKAGREALETLRDGHPVFSPGAAVPSIRVFVRAA